MKKMLHKNAIKYVEQKYTLIFIYYVIRFGSVRIPKLRCFGILPASVHHCITYLIISLHVCKKTTLSVIYEEKGLKFHYLFIFEKILLASHFRKYFTYNKGCTKRLKSKKLKLEMWIHRYALFDSTLGKQ